MRTRPCACCLMRCTPPWPCPSSPAMQEVGAARAAGAGWTWPPPSNQPSEGKTARPVTTLPRRASKAPSPTRSWSGRSAGGAARRRAAHDHMPRSGAASQRRAVLRVRRAVHQHGARDGCVAQHPCRAHAARRAVRHVGHQLRVAARQRRRRAAAAGVCGGGGGGYSLGGWQRCGRRQGRRGCGCGRRC